MMESDDELLPTTLLSNADMLETILKQLSPKALGLAECTCRDIRIAATSSSGVWPPTIYRALCLGVPTSAVLETALLRSLPPAA